MRIIAAGVSGFLGARLTSALTADGHDVVRLVRRPAQGPAESTWDPDRGQLDHAVFDGADAVINLCGAGIGDHRWTHQYKQLLWSSRVTPTRVLAEECAQSGVPTLLNASGTGFYGARHDTRIDTERSPAGETFLAEVCVDWEAATEAAVQDDVRVVLLRTAPVIGRDGGMLTQLAPVITLGLGGRLGRGDQWFPWISVTDWVRAVRHLLNSTVDGAVNMAAPYPVSNAEFMSALARQYHRPAPWVVPAPALHLVLGQFAEELLGGQRAVPTVLHDDGFEFSHRTLDVALAAELG